MFKQKLDKCMMNCDDHLRNGKRMKPEYESATDFKDFEALYNIVFDIDDQLLCSDVQTEVG